MTAQTPHPNFIPTCREGLAELRRLQQNLRGARTAFGTEGDGAGADTVREAAENCEDDARILDEYDPALAAEIRAAVASARATADDGADLAPPEWQARAAEDVDALIEQVERTGDAGLPFANARALAGLDEAGYAQAKQRLKKRLGRDLNLKDLNRAVRDVQRKRARVRVADDGLPRIVVADQPLRDLAEESLRALRLANDPPRLYVRGGTLARFRLDEHHRPIIERATPPTVRGLLSEAANYVVTGERGDRHALPPEAAVDAVLDRGDWPFPTLDAVIEAPALRPDGTLLDEAGYDPATRLILAPVPGLDVPEVPAEPSAADLAAARELILDELLADFPFINDASRANAFALLLTAVLRPAIRGQAPLALIDATKAGTGKGLLATLTALIATGRPAAITPAPVREEEWAKQLFAMLAEGATMIVLDEADTLASKHLASALTADTYNGRVLGRSETATVPQRATWAATGNNIATRGDLHRRCYRIKLDAKTARPWQRHGFRHADLIGWVAAHRGQLLASLLTLGRGWYAAEQPRADVPTLGGFDEWARTIGGVLAHAEVPGFLHNLDDYEQADEEATEWQGFLEAWADRYRDEPITAHEVADGLRHDHGAALRHALPSDLADAYDRAPTNFTRRLGKQLAKRQGTRYGNGARELHIEQASIESRGGRVLWRVVAGMQVPQVSVCATRGRSSGVQTHHTTPSAPQATQTDLQDLHTCEDGTA